jgi:ABC-type branched-subunit amino acid transport system ATPase component
MSSAPLLVGTGLHKRFGGNSAVDACNIEVAANTITGLIGPNGSGKTTLFNLLTGYLPADEGTMAFDGRRVRTPQPQRLFSMGLARTFQQARVFGQLTVFENLVVARSRPWRRILERNANAADAAAAMALLEDFGLASKLDQKASSLSYGQRKLLEFATALMGTPKLVLLDEPTAGVNPTMVQTMERHIRDWHERGVSFLIVEHDMGVVMRLCDPVIVLDRGRPIASGAPDAVRSDPAVLDAYLGE